MSYLINPSTYNYGNLTIGPVSATTGYTYTTGSTSASDLTWSTSSNPVSISQSAKIELKGEEADIIINGESLNETLKEIKHALRIPSKLNQDPSLEKAWEELQAAADHYNKLKQEYKEKQRVWDTLKTQD
jgi:predicted dehydrogenase